MRQAGDISLNIGIFLLCISVLIWVFACLGILSDPTEIGNAIVGTFIITIIPIIVGIGLVGHAKDKRSMHTQSKEESSIHKPHSLDEKLEETAEAARSTTIDSTDRNVEEADIIEEDRETALLTASKGSDKKTTQALKEIECYGKFHEYKDIKNCSHCSVKQRCQDQDSKKYEELEKQRKIEAERQRKGYMYYFNEGIAYNQKDDRDQAIKNYNISLEINPEFAEAHLNKGLILEKCNRREEAIESLKAFLKYAHPETNWIIPIKIAVEKIFEIEGNPKSKESIKRLRKFLREYKYGFEIPGGFDTSDMKDYIICIFEVANLKTEEAISSLKEVDAEPCRAEIALAVGTALKELGKKAKPPPAYVPRDWVPRYRSKHITDGFVSHLRRSMVSLDVLPDAFRDSIGDFVGRCKVCKTIEEAITYVISYLKDSEEDVDGFHDLTIDNVSCADFRVAYLHYQGDIEAFSGVIIARISQNGYIVKFKGRFE